MYPLLPAGPSVDLAEAFGARTGVRLRLYVMHTGFPYLESIFALFHLHPNVDVGALHAPFAAAERRSENGFAKRIMFRADFDFRQPGINL
jgi:hypothetical protein